MLFLCLKKEQPSTDSDLEATSFTNDEESVLNNKSHVKVDVEPEVNVETMNNNLNLEYTTSKNNEELLKLSGNFFLLV